MSERMINLLNRAPVEETPVAVGVGAPAGPPPSWVAVSDDTGRDPPGRARSTYEAAYQDAVDYLMDAPRATILIYQSIAIVSNAPSVRFVSA